MGGVLGAALFYPLLGVKFSCVSPKSMLPLNGNATATCNMAQTVHPGQPSSPDVYSGQGFTGYDDATEPDVFYAIDGSET